MTAVESTSPATTKADQLEQLLARVALRDQQALQRLYDLVAPWLNAVAMKIVYDEDLSNDVLQETFLQIWQNAGEYRRSQSEPITWMTALLRYRALDKLKTEQREQKRRNQFEEAQELFGETQFDSPVSGLLQGEADGHLHRCLSTLEAANKNAILMAYYYGYSREDIAIHMAQPVNTVKTWLKRGLTRLAQCLNH